MEHHEASAVIDKWPYESKEAASLVMDKYGPPDEATDSMLIWHNNGPWKRTVAYRDFARHNFPVPHTDSIENFIKYSVPPDKIDDLARFDGSVMVERTTGEISARCHDEEANMLALNLSNDIVTGRKTVEEARDYYAYEFLAYRRKEPTPYMSGLHFTARDGTEDPDRAVLTDDDLRKAVEEGKAKVG